MRKKSAMLFLAGSLCASALAQRPGPDPLQRYLFPPELVMRHQGALELTESQKNYIIGQIQQAQSEFTALQWNLQGEVENLSSLLEKPSVEEEKLLEQLDKVLDLERRVKRTHLLLAVRIKNQLTPEQRAKLEQIDRNRPNPNPPRREPPQPRPPQEGRKDQP